MSRWSADVLRVALAPREAALLRRHGTRVSRVLVANDGGAASLLPLLEDALADPACRSRRVEVVLSQHFVRHVLTPPPGKALSRGEERALVTAGLNDIYGEEAGRWNVQVISQPPQFGLFGAAVEASFARQLDAVLAQRGFRDVEIRPLASYAARHLPRNFSGWWALAEPGWLSLFGGAGGMWEYFSGQPVGDDWASALPELIERESGLTGLSLPPTVWVQAVGTAPVAKPATNIARWEIVAPQDAEARRVLALAGI